MRPHKYLFRQFFCTLVEREQCGQPECVSHVTGWVMARKRADCGQWRTRAFTLTPLTAVHRQRLTSVQRSGSGVGCVSTCAPKRGLAALKAARGSSLASPCPRHILSRCWLPCRRRHGSAHGSVTLSRRVFLEHCGGSSFPKRCGADDLTATRTHCITPLRYPLSGVALDHQPEFGGVYQRYQSTKGHTHDPQRSSTNVG